MSDHDLWLESQSGCYDPAPFCSKCGYELCEEHALCRHCTGCLACDDEEEAEQVAKKPPVSIPARRDQRRIG